MRKVFLAASFIAISSPAFADFVAVCEYTAGGTFAGTELLPSLSVSDVTPLVPVEDNGVILLYVTVPQDAVTWGCPDTLP